MKLLSQVKKFKVLTGLCLVLAFPLHGQVLIGPTMGGQMNWINFNDKGNRDLYSVRPSSGYHAGASIAFRMMKNVFLQSSFLYTQKGKYLVGKKDKQFKNSAKYNYIDIPITFTKEVKMKFGKGKFYNVYFGAGPTISYWLGGKGKLNSSDLNENFINPPDYNLSYRLTFQKDPSEVSLGEMNIQNPNRLQLGLNFTVGLVFEPDKLNKFMITTRYELGHSYLSPDSQGDYGLSGILFYKDDLQSRYQGVAVSLFYFIDLKTAERKKGKSTINIKRL